MTIQPVVLVEHLDTITRDPSICTSRKSSDLLAKGFGRGFNGPLLIVAEHRENASFKGPQFR
jgi:hypothetical protein